MTLEETVDIAEILKLGDQRYNAMVAGDADALADLLDDRCVYTHSNAVRDTKATYLSLFRSGHFNYVSVNHPVDRVEIVGDTAVVVGDMTAKVITAGVPRELDNRATAVWVRAPRGWRLMSYQSTPKPVPVP